MKVAFYLNLKMKKMIRKIFTVLLLIVSVLFLSNCDKNKPGELKVLVKTDTKYWGNVLVKIYNSQSAFNNDSAFAQAKTTIAQPEIYGALFTDLAPQKYYIKSVFVDGNDNYSGDGEAIINSGKQTVFTLEVTKEATGSLEIYVRENALNGPYVPDATVELYLSESDRNNGYVYKTAKTPTVDFDKNGAKFENLAYQQYFLKAYFTKGADYWLGVNETFITIGSTKSVNILCTK